jgi:WD40 repeat protein
VESQTVVSAGLDIWDVATGRMVRSYGPPRDAFFFTTLDVSPDGSVALGGGIGECCNGRLRVWSVETGRELDRMTPGGGDVLVVAFGPDGQRMVSGGWADESKVWDADGRLLTVLPDRGYVGYSADFSPDGRLIAVAAIRGTHLETGHVKIWDWRHRRLVQEIDAPGAASVDFDPSSDRIGIATWEAVAGVWDVGSGQRVTDLAGHSGKIDDISFSPDGSLIATAGVDGRVRVFDAGTGDRRLVLRHACGVNSLDFSPDGSMLASIGPCDGVRVWALEIDDLLDIARREVLPALTDEACRDLFDVSVCSDV